MKLSYFEGKNFGDAINPLIFHHHFPGFFDDDNTELFLGIGSILGFIKPEENTRKAIVFSSGFAYDDIPQLDNRYDVRCVRGPQTAKALGLDSALAVADGAVLLPTLTMFNQTPEKKYRYCFIPHHVSEKMYDRWENLFDGTDVEYVSPAQNPDVVIQKIRESEIVLAEAMHAAIIADTFRVPWIPVKMFRHVNNFKWQDWMNSMDLGKYEPISLTRLYNPDWIAWIFFDKLKIKEKSQLNKLLSSFYRGYQTHIMEPGYRKKLQDFQSLQPKLSDSALLTLKQEKLLEIIADIKRDYPRA